MEFVDGYFFTMDEVRKSLIQKSDDGSTVFEYPCSIDPLYKIYVDDFTGNTYNDDYWILEGSRGGFRNNRFWSHVNPGSNTGQAALYSKFRAKGAYDIRVDYNLVIFPNTNRSDAQLNLRNMDRTPVTQLQVRREYNSGHSYYAGVNNGTSWSQVGKVTGVTVTNGGLRFTRPANNSTTTVYYRSGVSGNWTSMGSTSTIGIGNSNNVMVGIYADTDVSFPEIEVEFDNFYMSIMLGPIKDLQYDGIYFWSLQDILGTNEIIIRKWLIKNYTCLLVDEFLLVSTAGTIFSSSAMAIEHYNTKVSTPIVSGDDSIRIDEYHDTVISPGSILTIRSADDYIEDVVVSEVVGGDLMLVDNTLFDHPAGSNVAITPSFFIFNNYTGTSSINGSLMRFDAHTGNYLTSDSMLEYKDVTAATFDRFQNILRGYDDASALVFVKNTEARFRNMSDLLSLTSAYSANDDFSGEDESFPNTTLWDIAQGNPRIYDNSLFCSTVVGGYDEVISKYLLTGDFDVQVSGSCGSLGNMIPIDPSDAFTYSGTGGIPDPNKWVTSGDLIYLDNDALYMATDSTVDYNSVTSTFFIRGDFDVQVDIDIVNGPAQNSWNSELRMKDIKSTLHLAVRREYSGSHRFSRIYYNGSSEAMGSATTLDIMSSKLRLARVGNTTTCYHWTGSAWSSRGTNTNIGANDVIIEIVHRRTAATSLTSAVRFSNFTVVGDAYPLLSFHKYTDGSGVEVHGGLGDDFTYSGTGGSPDIDKWSIGGDVDNVYLDNNTLCMRTTISGGINSSINSTFSLQGDFDYQIDIDTTGCPNTAHWASEIRAMTETRYLALRREYDGAHKFNIRYYNGSTETTAGSVTNTLAKSKLRLVRIGSTITCYYWTGAVWSSRGTNTGLGTDDVTIRVIHMRSSTTFPVSVVRFNNFIINSADSVDSFRYFHGIRLKFPSISNHWCELVRRSELYGVGNCIQARYNQGSVVDQLTVPTDATNYNLRITRTGSTVGYYYKTVTNGVMDDDWTLFGTKAMYDVDCYLSLYLYSSKVTVSGAYFDDLEYTSGNIRYQSDTIPYYGIMNLDNIRANGSTIIPVYDISYSDGNLYRLQNEGTYYGVNNSWGSQYNYVCSTVRSFVDSISVQAYPVILPADGRNIASINCVVLDQFSNGAVEKPIFFVDNDDYGYVTINPKYTDTVFKTGKATTYYRAGVDVHTVTIQGTVTQYD